MTEQTSYQEHKKLLRREVPPSLKSSKKRATTPSLSSFLPLLLFGLFCLGWFKLDALTGSLYQAQMIPALLIIGLLLLLRAMSRE